MRRFQLWAGLGAVLFFVSLAWADDWRDLRTGSDLPWVCRALVAEAPYKPGGTERARAALTALMAQTPNLSGFYARAEAGRALAQGAVYFSNQEPALSAELIRAADQALASFDPWLADYGQTIDVHGFKEPAWIQGQPDAVALAVLAWCDLEKLGTDPARLSKLTRFSEGLMACFRKSAPQYPFRAHTSFSGNRPDLKPYAPIPAGRRDPNLLPDQEPEVELAPGAVWQAHRNNQAAALAVAGKLTGNQLWVDSACQEGLGIWAHLAVSGQIPFSFAPHPEGQGRGTDAAVMVDNFMQLYRATEQPVFAVLAGVGASWFKAHPAQKPADQAAQALAERLIERTAAQPYAQAVDLDKPFSYQVMECENGRAVKKAFDEFEVVYPGGTPGKMVRVGRENMFWMRFDVERADDYYFYLIFLKSPLEGGLVSIMMRIDGDKIFQVPFGGATDPYVDMDLVEGPRFLRQGPHSFGIRFSGLLMTQPAILDAVIAWPVVERRYMQLSDGREMLILHNRSDQSARATFTEIGNWPPPTMMVVDELGKSAQLKRESDRRRRREYIMVPAGGVAVLQWKPSQKATPWKGEPTPTATPTPTPQPTPGDSAPPPRVESRPGQPWTEAPGRDDPQPTPMPEE